VSILVSNGLNFDAAGSPAVVIVLGDTPAVAEVVD
jgi:hypothetical protein